MRVDLVKLLRERSVAHPSRIVAANLEGREFRVRVVGWPWWLEHADVGRDQEIELIFGGVGEGVLDPRDFDSEYNEALESFSVVASDDLPWEQSGGSKVYCNAPLPKPLNMFLVVHEFLASHDTFRRASHYLNCASSSERLAPFLQITQTTSYLLGHFPPAIRSLVCAELDAQGVSYTEFLSAGAKPRRLLVTIEMSQFFCETAEAVFDA